MLTHPLAHRANVPGQVLYLFVTCLAPFCQEHPEELPRFQVPENLRRHHGEPFSRAYPLRAAPHLRFPWLCAFPMDFFYEDWYLWIMPEKSLNEVPRDVRELYQKGTVALQRQNFDYALAIFQQVLQREPGFFDCRQALRATQYKKNGTSSGFFKKMIGGASSSPMIAKGQLSLRNNPLDALQTAEQILNSDPTNTSAHKLLAEAALGADLPRTAALSLE